MTTFCAEPLEDVLPELKLHFATHWRELALNQDQVPLSPQYDRYLAKAAAGEIVCVVGRDVGQVVAYYVGFVGPGLHYSTCLTCVTDIWFVNPTHRTGTAGIRLLKAVEAELRRRGVQRWFLGGKIARRGGEVNERGRELREVTTDPSALFERLGAERVEITYSKWLE